MIKRIYYYFKLKELLKMKELMPFVEYLLKIKPKQESLFIFCMEGQRPIIHWFDCLIRDYQLKKHAEIFAIGINLEYPIEFVTETLKKRFNQAKDIWRKSVKVY